MKWTDASKSSLLTTISDSGFHFCPQKMCLYAQNGASKVTAEVKMRKPKNMHRISSSVLNNLT